VCDHDHMMEQQEYEDFPPEDEDEAPPDALPASPVLRKVVIAIYILIVICVIGGLLLSMVWSGIFSNRFGFPLPDAWSI
jgi:hypothetical protein